MTAKIPGKDCVMANKSIKSCLSSQLGLDGNQIYLSYRIHISDIFSDFAEEIQKNITDMAFKADEMDNYLADTFGCEFSEYAKKDAI